MLKKLINLIQSNKYISAIAKDKYFVTENNKSQF